MIRFGFLLIFQVGFTKKMSEYFDQMVEKLELLEPFLVKPFFSFFFFF